MLLVMGAAALGLAIAVFTAAISRNAPLSACLGVVLSIPLGTAIVLKKSAVPG
jgi:hypothetical protein